MISRRMRRTATSGVLIAGLTAAACQLVAPLEGEPRAPVPPAPPPLPEPSPFCRVDPPPPAPNGLPTGGDLVIELALASLALEPPRGDAGTDPDFCTTLGFDLDGRRTCLDADGGRLAPPSDCDGGREGRCAAAASCVNRTKGHDPCDQRGGVDNASASITAFLQSLPHVDGRPLTPDITLRSGRANLLLRIAGYNGTPDDGDVDVRLAASSGLVESTAPIRPDDAASISRAELPLPWDGRSRRTWYLDPSSSIGDGGVAPSFQAHGYVKSGVLFVPDGAAAVARAPVLVPLVLPLPVERIQLVAELRLAGTDWVITRGTLAGRVAQKDAYEAIGREVVFFEGRRQAVCEIDRAGLLVAQSCALPDLGDVPNGPCTHISLGAAFTAVPALFGPIRPMPRAPVDASCVTTPAPLNCDALAKGP